MLKRSDSFCKHIENIVTDGLLVNLIITHGKVFFYTVIL